MTFSCIECIAFAVALHDSAEAILAVVNSEGSGPNGSGPVAAFWSCSSQNVPLVLPPGCRAHGTGVSIFRNGRCWLVFHSRCERLANGGTNSGTFSGTFCTDFRTFAAFCSIFMRSRLRRWGAARIIETPG